MNDELLLIIPFSTGLDLTGFSPFSCPSSQSSFARDHFFVIHGLESDDHLMFANFYYNKTAPDSENLQCLISSCMLPALGLKSCRQNLQGGHFGECPRNQCPVAIHLCDNASRIVVKSFRFLSASPCAGASLPCSVL